jgi:hypothetical protein
MIEEDGDHTNGHFELAKPPPWKPVAAFADVNSMQPALPVGNGGQVVGATQGHQQHPRCDRYPTQPNYLTAAPVAPVWN